MKKLALLVALALSSTMLFAGCGYTNQTETAANVEGNDMVGTTWVLTDFNMKPPVKPSDDGSLEDSEISDEVADESRPEPPSGEEIAEYLNVSLEFKEDDKVSMTSNSVSKEFTYSQIHNQEDEPYIAITGDKNNSFAVVVEDDTMTFSTMFGGSMIFEKQ